MKAQELMTKDPACCTAEDTVQHAAKLMAEHDCGCIPVVDDTEARHLVGVVTDRDLACRGLAHGHGGATKVREVMSAEPSCCAPDDDLEQVEQIMAERQVRRVPVIDEQDCCVGMIAQADLAHAAETTKAVDERALGQVVERVSASTPGARAEASVGRRPSCC